MRFQHQHVEGKASKVAPESARPALQAPRVPRVPRGRRLNGRGPGTASAPRTRTGCFSNASARIIRQAASKHCACRGDGVEGTPPPAGCRRRDAFIHAGIILDAFSAPACRRQSFESGAGVRAASPRRRANILRRVGDDPVGDPRPRSRRPRGTPGAWTAGAAGLDPAGRRRTRRD